MFLKSVLILSLRFALLPFNVVQTAAVTSNVQCRASFEPEVIIVKQNTNQTHQNIRCAAEISSDNFSKPIFELSFGFSPSTGVYLLRGDTRCSSDGQKCWSDFKVFAFALRQLLLQTVREQYSTHNHAYDQLSSLSASQIEITCNVVDSARNKRIGCSQSANIRYANVLSYGQKCSINAESESECSTNMDCLGGRCVCQVGFLPHRLARREILCLEKANLGEKCNFTQQCTAKQANSVCEFEQTIQHKTCKCLSGYEEVKGENEQYHCSKVIVLNTTQDKSQNDSLPTNTGEKPSALTKAALASSTTTTITTKSSQNNQVSSTTEMITDFELFDSMDDENQHQDLRSMAMGLAKSTHFILITVGLFIFLTIFLIAFAIRSRNYGEMEVKKKNAKLANRKPTGAGPPLLGLVNKVGTTEMDETFNLKRENTPTADGNDNDDYEDEADTSTNRGDSPFLSFESDDVANLHSKQSTV